MPSFAFADCPTRLDLSLAAGTGEQTGSLSCTLRNTTAKRQTARIRIEALEGAKPAWFQLAGAPPTSPLEIEEDIAAGGTLTVGLDARVPAGTPAGTGSVRLRAISETAPDTDFTEGPAIGFTIAAPAAPPAPTKSTFPWWAVAVAAALVLVVVGAVTYLAWPSTLDPKLVIGKPLAEAQKIASEKGFEGIAVETGEAWGNNPADQVVVGYSPQRSAFSVDNGVSVPPDILGRPYAEAVQLLLDRGLLPAPVVLGMIGGPPGHVMQTIPAPGVPLPMGAPITIVVGAVPMPPAFMAGQFPCQALRGACAIPLRTYGVDDLNAVSRDRLKNREHMVDIILRGP